MVDIGEQLKSRMSTYRNIEAKVKLPSPVRSAGDGMEDNSSSQQTDLKHLETTTPKSDPSSCNDKITSRNTVDFPIALKRREPKFVPYEPYKAAVTPIIPPTSKKIKDKRSKSKKGGSKHLTEIRIPFPLVAEEAEKVSTTDQPVIRILRDVSGAGLDGDSDDGMTWEEERISLKKEIQQLKEEKHELENQFKVQTQVNAELKKLLVASLGEDLQTRVQFLSEDKARLAEDISFYSAKLQEDLEEMDKLAIQCDVWRSKFLASSLMIDELAGWKAQLSNHCEEYKEAIGWLFSEHQTLQSNLVSSFVLLKELKEAFDPVNTKSIKEPTNLIQLSNATHQLSSDIFHRLLGERNLQHTSSKLDPTPAEEFARKLLFMQNNLPPLGSKEKPSNHVTNISSKCNLHESGHSDPFVMACCRHCSGHLQLV